MPPLIRRVFPIVALTCFAAMIGTGIILPLLPVYATNMGATGIWIGIIVAGYSVSRAIAMPFIGRLSDRMGRKFFMVLGLALYTLLSMAYVWAQDVYQLSLVRFFHGIAAGMIMPVARAYIGDLSPKGEEATWMGYFNTAFLGGLGLGPVIGGLLYDKFSLLPPVVGVDTGMVAVFGCMGAISLLSMFLALAFLPSLSQERAQARKRPKPDIPKMLRSLSFQGIFGYRILEALGRRAWFTMLPVLAGIHLGLDGTQIGLLVATNALTSSVLQAFTGRAMDRIKINRRMVIVFGCLFQAAYLVATPFAQEWWQLMVISAVAGIRVAVSTPATSAMIVVEGRQHGMGQVISMMATAMSIGMAIGPLLAGAIYDWKGIGSVFYAAAAIVLIAAVWFSVTTRRADREADPPPDAVLTASEEV
jgi:MFS transporter, DHA1 family, multidrug resistance protein